MFARWRIIINSVTKTILLGTDYYNWHQFAAERFHLFHLAILPKQQRHNYKKWWWHRVQEIKKQLEHFSNLYDTRKYNSVPVFSREKKMIVLKGGKVLTPKSKHFTLHKLLYHQLWGRQFHCQKHWGTIYEDFAY